MEFLSNLKHNTFVAFLVLGWFSYTIYTFMMADVMTWWWFAIDAFVLYHLVKWFIGALQHNMDQAEDE